MTEQIVLTKDDHWFHDDYYGRYYYKNHEQYLNKIRTYLIKCIRCNDWIYPRDKITFDINSRVGQSIIHNNNWCTQWKSKQ